jgi:hypothetical protein|tara:strand:+ start:8235 stop:8465 length:231 start_codon:yes stop_codon:yes gene_type:complete
LQIGKALAFMSKGTKIAGKLWSQSGRVSKTFLKQLGKMSPKASACGVTTPFNKWRLALKTKSHGFGTHPRLPLQAC